MNGLLYNSVAAGKSQWPYEALNGNANWTQKCQVFGVEQIRMAQ